MIDRVKVIKGLGDALQLLANHVPERYLGYSAGACLDAITLLKAQEPHVIKFDEIDNFEVLWLEVRDVDTDEGLAQWVKVETGRWFSPLVCGKEWPDRILVSECEYGRFCRCWASRPTDAQREAIPWACMNSNRARFAEGLHK